MRGDDPKSVEFMNAEGSPDEHARRSKTEVDRLASLPTVEWLFYLEDVAKKPGVPLIRRWHDGDQIPTQPTTIVGGNRRQGRVENTPDLLPLLDDEAVAHALIEVAMGHETVPRDRQALCALINKYRVHRTQGDA
jgi:hypothetical protein